ncbi:MAG: restriction endonuclease subunit S [Gemmatimonadaceae bacterium]|nr:restriction endonuclease subunit S [Gemmatimonadaceae bacterium]
MSEVLPPGWAVVPLGSVAHVQLGKMLSAAAKTGRGARPYLRNINVRWHRIDVDDVFSMDFNEREVEKFTLRSGDVLVCEGGEPGRAAVWRDQLPGALYQKALHRVRFIDDAVDPDFFVYQLELIAATGELARGFTGSTIKHLPREVFVELPLRIAPIAEQRRIVAVLEEKLSSLDAAVAGLERARTRLSLYLESSVQAAVSNMLERGLMDDDTNTQFEWKPLAAVLADIGQGWSPRCVPDPPADEKGWAVIKTTAIQPFRFDSSECKGLPEGLSPRPEIEIHVGDLLVTRKGPRSRAGVAAAVKQTRSRVMICDTVYRIRLKAEMARPHFMAIAMSSTVVAAAIDRAKAGISESGLSLTHDRLGAILVPLPPLGVQEAIENEIDRRVQVVDRVNADIDLQLARAARLRQSILQRAFSGGLVPQDPAEAPTSIVADPDRTERASAPASSRPARGRGRTARTGSRRG